MVPNCNRCNIGIGCRGESNMERMSKCKKFIAPRDKWKLAEMALVNPTGLNEVLSEFPFHTGLDTILRGRG